MTIVTDRSMCRPNGAYLPTGQRTIRRDCGPPRRAQRREGGRSAGRAVDHTARRGGREVRAVSLCRGSNFLRTFNGLDPNSVHLLATVLQWPRVAARVRESRTGEFAMARVHHEILMYSCVAAFVTGIVVLAAAALIS